MHKNLIIILAIYIVVLITGLVMNIMRPQGENREAVDEIAHKSFTVEIRERDEKITEAQMHAETSSQAKLVIEDIEPGNGLMAKEGDTVSVHYTGMFESGEVFDTSEAPDRGPYQFTLGSGQVIEGWERGLPGMRVGGVRRLTVPPRFAYGESGFGAIPSNATLIFEIELLSVFE